MNEITEFTYQGVNLKYSPETGKCWRQLKRGSWNLITPVDVAGGYTKIGICGRGFKLHRIIAEVFLNNGQPLAPQQEVDHIQPADGSHAQDRLSNLRIVSHSQNLKNQRIARNNKSGYKGVSWEKKANQWRAQIVSCGRRKYLGLFATPEAAALAYDKAAKKLHGEFAKLNFN
jgi:hypothetical protein